MITPTPETDKRIGIINNGSNVVDASWARQLERERDQLCKVCNAMARQYRHEMMSMFGHDSDCDCSRCEPMTKLYNSLPHVIAAKEGNEV